MTLNLPDVRVGIGLVRRGDLFLVRPRPAGHPLAGLWEFPGGKCRPGEPPDRAVRRECLEETGFAVRAVGLRQVVRHVYDHARLELHFFDCAPFEPTDEPASATGFRWVHARDLAALRFPDANQGVVAELCRGFEADG